MAVELEPNPKVLTPFEILELAKKRTQSFRTRDALYDVYSLYYYGQQPSDESVSVLSMNAQGRPLLRDLESIKGAGKIYSTQRLSPIVDDAQALIGRMPNSRSEPPDPAPEGEAKAELLTKYLISTHEISDMDRQQAEAGFHLSAYGDACYLFEPDPILRRVVWTVVDPRCAYPEFYRGYRRYQVADLVLQTVEEPDTLRRAYGYKASTNSKADCTVTTYVSAHQRTIVIGGDQDYVVGPHVEWNLGFCPVQWIFNKVNGRYGQSDIGQSINQQDFLDFAYNILIDGLVRNTYGTIIGIVDPQNVANSQIQVGPNPPPIMLQQGGQITATHIGGDIQPAMRMIDQTIQDINAGAGTSQVRQEGQMHGSIQTGRAIQASQGPQATRLDLKQQNMGAGLRSANAMTIEMQVKAPYLGKRKFEIFGRFKGKSFNEKISGDDLKWDGAIWTRNTVTWDSLMGLNLQQKEMIATQGKISKLWDSIYAMELVGVDDPIGMQKRIEASDIHDAEVQAKVQGILGGGGAPGGAPPGAGGGGGRPPTSPGGGGQPPSPPAPQQMVRPPALAAQQPQGLPTGVPSGISTEAMKKALADVADKLHGPVWAVGEVAINGQSAHPQLLVADYRDAATVMRTLKPLVPGLKVQAAKKETPPEAVRVA